MKCHEDLLVNHDESSNSLTQQETSLNLPVKCHMTMTRSKGEMGGVREAGGISGVGGVTDLGGIRLRHYREFLCGWGAAFCNITITFPINKVMFRQQLYGVKTFRAINQLRKEGLRNLYRGLLPPLLQKTTSNALMFGSYYKIQQFLQVEFPDNWRVTNRATAAILAGAVEATLTPFERIQVLMQDKNYTKRFSNTVHAFKEVKGYGFKEFYRGQMPIMYRNCLSNVPFFLTRDYVMETFPTANNPTQKIIQDFFSGAFLGAFLSTVFYPVNVVKVRMQSKLGGEFTGFIQNFRIVLKDRGYSVRKIFRGVHINYTRSFMSWGIINATYELLMKHCFHMDVNE